MSPTKTRQFVRKCLHYLFEIGDKERIWTVFAQLIICIWLLAWAPN